MSDAIRIIEKDLGWKRIAAEARAVGRRARVKVGLQAGARHDSEDGPADLVEIAATHEFGDPKRHIPERSFIRATIDKHEDHFERLIGAQWERIIEGKQTVSRALDRIGQDAEDKMKARIRSRIAPSLSVRTLARKTVRGKTGDVPLIDTGQLIQSIRYVKEL